jgi:DNA-binding beta-propeller fold protein YncE
MNASSKLPWKIGLALILAGLAVLPGSSSTERVPPVRSHIDGQSRLVSVEPLSMDGMMCALPEPGAAAAPAPVDPVPINPVTVALGITQDRSLRPIALAQQGGVAPTSASDARRTAVAARKPLRTIRDRYPQFSAVAVDPVNDEVVLQDENLFQIQVFDRTTNTPATAAMSEPKRNIAGPATYLELNCALYIDPKTGNIYSLNNDTERHMTVWDRNARGDASPLWKLRTPMGSFGLAVDEEREELLITAQHEQVVAAYSKFAREDDPPRWVLWGDKTLIADPHGIAIDTKLNVFFVANFGSTISPRQARPGEDPLLVAVARGNMVHGSGRFLPPSITVYDRTARGDTAPIRVITGPRTQLNWPAGLFVDPERGELFVANDGGNSILVFSTTANGDVAPLRVLSGPRTKLAYPSSIFVDFKNDELWVANMGNHRATVYRRTASGDTAPLREIRSAPEGTPSPTLANVRIGYDTRRDQILAPN